jgi:HEAT repeat protein
VNEDGVERLFTAAVDRWRAVTGPEGYESVWELVCQVARSGPETVPFAARETASSDVAVRAIACDLLGVLSERYEEARWDSATALVALAAKETDDDVLWSIARALGGTRDSRGLPVLLGLAGHSDGDVRFQVAVSLPSVMGDDLSDDAGVAALIALCGDEEPEVRDWATFGLGFQCEVDGPLVRETLWARTTDSHRDAREEGIRGLARRRVAGAVPLLAELLDQSDVHVHTFYAAGFARDPALVASLELFDPADLAVAAALRECDPARRAQRDSLAVDLLEKLWADPSDWDLMMVSHLFEVGITLVATKPEHGPNVSWSVESLLERAGGDATQAARLVLADLAESRR